MAGDKRMRQGHGWEYYLQYTSVCSNPILVTLQLRVLGEGIWTLSLTFLTCRMEIVIIIIALGVASSLTYVKFLSSWNSAWCLENTMWSLLSVLLFIHSHFKVILKIWLSPLFHHSPFLEKMSICLFIPLLSSQAVCFEMWGQWREGNFACEYWSFELIIIAPTYIHSFLPCCRSPATLRGVKR